MAMVENNISTIFNTFPLLKVCTLKIFQNDQRHERKVLNLTLELDILLSKKNYYHIFAWSNTKLKSIFTTFFMQRYLIHRVGGKIKKSYLIGNYAELVHLKGIEIF